MEFLLINSPLSFEANDDEDFVSPLGLGYIATSLENEGIQVVLLDCLKEHISVESLFKYIECEQPKYIGINIFTPNYHIVKHIIENINISCQCFIGGQVVKNIYKDISNWHTNNLLNIIIGEGEYIIPNIVKGNCKEIPVYTNDRSNVYCVNENSDYFPKDLSKVQLNRKYFVDDVQINHYGKSEIAIVTSRGCIYNCAFCGGARSLNSDVCCRTRSVESVVEEIRNIVYTYPQIESIRILDDLFLRDLKSINLAVDIFNKFPNLEWRAMVHALSLKDKCDKIAILKKSNCRELFMGIESGSEEMRKYINKAGGIEDVIKASAVILENGIDLKGYFIYGFPHENESQFQATYILAKKISEIAENTEGNFRTSVFQFRPYHGTKLYEDILREKGNIAYCELNEHISKFKGRSQFNYSSGNYSDENDEVLYEYITKTQELSRS